MHGGRYSLCAEIRASFIEIELSRRSIASEGLRFLAQILRLFFCINEGNRSEKDLFNYPLELGVIL